MKISLTICVAALCLSASAQQIDKKQLLAKVNTAVSNLKEGEFEYHDTYSSAHIGEDTVYGNHVYKISFIKNSADTVIGYKLASFNNGYAYIYDGYNLWSDINNTLVTTDKISHPEKIKGIKFEKQLYPFFSMINDYLQPYEKKPDNIKILGIENYKGEPCYKISLDVKGAGGSQAEEFCYVSTITYIPIGQIIRLTRVTGQAKEVLTFDYWISGLKQGKLPDSRFTKAILPPYNREKQYDPNDKNRSELLPVGTAAPDWELPTVDGSTLKLSSLAGKIVVLDFWYKACAPCQEQMVALQKLHEKYDANKVVFVGVNTIDDPKKDKLQLFLKNRNITMLTVCNGKSIEGTYHTPYCPALFIIDKSGKVAYTIDGLSPTVLSEVSNSIDKNL